MRGRVAPSNRLRAAVYIRAPEAGDERELLAAARRSARLHRPWTYAPTTRAALRSRLAALARPENRCFVVCVRGSGAIAGVINVTQITLGPLRSAYLGYYAFAGFERRGYMRAGLRAVIRHAFRALRLHRLEANIQPGNQASIALVKACGFSKEGFSPRYLKIGGRWRDHERWAIVAN
jgi:[ribosomal protein S5]-alanine N-acetyltransferase